VRGTVDRGSLEPEGAPTAFAFAHFAMAAGEQRARCARNRVCRTFGLAKADGPWQLLLQLYVAAATGRRSAVGDITNAGDLAPTTGLRHLTLLEDRGLVMRSEDVRDGRRQFVGFTEVGLTMMRLCFEAMQV
jgi:hypothetical protein